MKTKTTMVNPVRNNYAPRVIALSVLGVLFLCALARIRAQTVDKAAVNPTGTFTLLSVGGKTVPCTINHEGTAMEVQSGTFTINTNNQITSVMIISVGDRKNIRVETSATYTEKNSELTMKWKNAGMTKGQIAGRTFTMTNEGMAYVYKK